MTRETKVYALAIAAPIALNLLLFALPFEVPVLTGTATMLFPLVLLLLTIGLIIASIASKNKHRPAAALLVVMLVWGVALGNGTVFGAQIHLLVNQHRYAGIIAQLAQAQSNEDRTAICGDDCFVMSTQPLRVGFHFCHRFLNWPDIVYDPSGEVASRDWDKLHRLDIYLYGADHLRGDWYLGRFGD